MMVHTALFINLMRKQLASMLNPTIPRKLSRKFQDRLKKDYPAYLQQKKYLKIRKIIMGSDEQNCYEQPTLQQISEN